MVFVDIDTAKNAFETLRDLMGLTREAEHAWAPDSSSLYQILAEGDLCSAYA